MTILVSNISEVRALEILLNKDDNDDLVIKLFKNNYTPVDGSLTSNFIEADFTGYADYDVNAADWTITPGNPSEGVHPQISFTSSAGSQNQDIYGYYVVETNSHGNLRWAERFTDGPYNIANNGDVIKITPKFTASKT